METKEIGQVMKALSDSWICGIKRRIRSFQRLQGVMRKKTQVITRYNFDLLQNVLNNLRDYLM